VEAQERSALLDHQKAMGQEPSNTVYLFKHDKEWKKDYVNPFQVGIFSEDLGAIKPNLASFKDAKTIKGYIRTVVSKVETILKNHQQSGHHLTREERLVEIKNSFLSPKGKNVDMSYFYVFLMPEDNNLNFASRQLEDGVGASAGFGKVGGGAPAAKGKRNRQEAVLTDIQQLTRKLSDSADGIQSETERANTKLFSPSPTYSDVSNPAVAVGNSSLDSYQL
jgi:oligoribonuclease NrnB/cAMP/cGMP phosphodiesterase (DHH superfamily)